MPFNQRTEKCARVLSAAEGTWRVLGKPIRASGSLLAAGVTIGELRGLGLSPVGAAAVTFTLFTVCEWTLRENERIKVFRSRK